MKVAEAEQSRRDMAEQALKEKPLDAVLMKRRAADGMHFEYLVTMGKRDERDQIWESEREVLARSNGRESLREYEMKVISLV